MLNNEVIIFNSMLWIFTSLFYIGNSLFDIILLHFLPANFLHPVMPIYGAPRQYTDRHRGFRVYGNTILRRR